MLNSSPSCYLVLSHIGRRTHMILDGLFCREVLKEALGKGTLNIFHTDAGELYTLVEFTKILADAGIEISRDSRARALDNVWVKDFGERLSSRRYTLRTMHMGLRLIKAFVNTSSSITKRGLIHPFVTPRSLLVDGFYPKVLNST